MIGEIYVAKIFISMYYYFVTIVLHDGSLFKIVFVFLIILYIV